MAQGWKTLPLGAGGLVTGMHIANDGSMVCRTDVGNIYRWSGLNTDYADGTKKWLPLLNYSSLGPSANRGSNNIGGWEHVLAPNNSSTHLAIFCDMAGNNGTDWLWYSTNSGGAWTKTNISFTGSSAASNNNPGAAVKMSNYKIAIDPANPNVAYCGVPVSSGNSAGAYTSLNQSGGSTLATWVSVKTSGATPVGAVSNTVSCGIAIDPSLGTATVGGQTVTKHIIIPVGGVGIYESVDGGVTFTEIAATQMTTGNFWVTNGGFNADGVYYCVVVHGSIFGIWRYVTGSPGTWTKINYAGAGSGDFISGSCLIIDPRTGAGNKAYLGFVNVNHGIGIGFSTPAASTGSPTWTGATGGQTAFLLAASYDIPWVNYVSGQSAVGQSPFSASAIVDLNGVLWWPGNQSLFYLGTSQANPAPAAALPSYPNSGLFTSYSWSMGRGQEATVSQDVLCPPGAPYPVLATQDLGTPQRGTFTTYPADQAVRYVEYTCENLDYAASDPSFIVARVTGQGSPLVDVSVYSASNGADTTWTSMATTPTSLWQATITATISGFTLTVSAITSGTTIFPYQWVTQNADASGTYYGRIQPYGTSGTTGTGGTGTYALDVSTSLGSSSIFIVGLVYGGQTVAVDHLNFITIPAGFGNNGVGQWLVPAHTTDGGTTWALCTGITPAAMMPRPWSFGSTCKPLAVGYGTDLGVVWAVTFSGTTATLYRSTNSGASFGSPIATWTIGNNFTAIYCLSLPGFPNELWVAGSWTSGQTNSLWHITNANTATATATAIAIPGAITTATALSIGAPSTGGGYPTLYLLGNTGFGTAQLLYQGSYPGSGSTVTWSLFGPTGTQQDLPASCQLCGIIAIRGDMNLYQRLYVASDQSGFAFFDPTTGGVTGPFGFTVIYDHGRWNVKMIGY